MTIDHPFAQFHIRFWPFVHLATSLTLPPFRVALAAGSNSMAFPLAAHDQLRFAGHDRLVPVFGPGAVPTTVPSRQGGSGSRAAATSSGWLDEQDFSQRIWPLPRLTSPARSVRGRMPYRWNRRGGRSCEEIVVPRQAHSPPSRKYLIDMTLISTSYLSTHSLTSKRQRVSRPGPISAYSTRLSFSCSGTTCNSTFCVSLHRQQISGGCLTAHNLLSPLARRCVESIADGRSDSERGAGC
jgi:hypothetical protein